MNSTAKEAGAIAGVVAAVLVVIAIVFGLILGTYAMWKATGRYQQRADAQNSVRVSTIEIQNQSQRVLIAQQQAQIRKENAVGIREAQDEIAKTLTPLYVQFEMTEALKEIARSGSNNSTVFIPSGPGGIPLVQGVGPSVGGSGK